MTIKKIVTTRYVDDNGFEFMFEPIEDTLTIEQTEEGYIARYLTQDQDPQIPEMDDNAFLVNYHRDFDVRRDQIITKDDLANWYQAAYRTSKEIPEHIDQEEQYWIFSLSMLSHSGVRLYLGYTTPPCDPGGWDTSHVGAVLIAKSEWETEEAARKYAEGMIKEWNFYLSGDVWGIVKETYDEDKEQTDEQSVWGFYGSEHAKQELKEL